MQNAEPPGSGTSHEGIALLSRQVSPASVRRALSRLAALHASAPPRATHPSTPPTTEASSSRHRARAAAALARVLRRLVAAPDAATAADDDDDADARALLRAEVGRTHTCHALM